MVTKERQMGFDGRLETILRLNNKHDQNKLNN